MLQAESTSKTTQQVVTYVFEYAHFLWDLATMYWMLLNHIARSFVLLEFMEITYHLDIVWFSALKMLAMELLIMDLKLIRGNV